MCDQSNQNTSLIITIYVCMQDYEINMLGEVTHLQTILDDLINLTAEPNKLPPASEQVPCSTSVWSSLYYKH